MPYEDLTAKKAELDKVLPFSDEIAADLRKRVELELTCVGNILDGSSLTRKDTSEILYEDKAVAGHSLTEHIQTLNVAKAYDLICDLALKVNRPVDDTDVRTIHGVMMRDLDDKNAGMYRGVNLKFPHSTEVLPDPVRVQRMMNDFGMWLYTARTLHPVALASEAHLRLMGIQPFRSGNPKTARMLMNLILMRNGYPPALISRREKKEYWDSLEKAIYKNDREEYDKLIYRSVNRAMDMYLKAAEQKQVVDVETEPYFLRIGQLAKETGERVSTLRYWTAMGLLETAGKTSADYTLYSSEVIEKIKQLKELKKERYTLDEIRKKMAD